jgi:hypothetical protein
VAGQIKKDAFISVAKRQVKLRCQCNASEWLENLDTPQKLKCLWCSSSACSVFKRASQPALLVVLFSVSLHLYSSCFVVQQCLSDLSSFIHVHANYSSDFLLCIQFRQTYYIVYENLYLSFAIRGQIQLLILRNSSELIQSFSHQIGSLSKRLHNCNSTYALSSLGLYRKQLNREQSLLHLKVFCLS